MGDTFKMPLGEALSNNAEALSEAMFSNVTVRRLASGDPPAEPNRVDAVLIPTVSVVERAMGAWAFGKMRTVIGVEWVLTDREGNLVWLQTIQGSGAANTGNIFTHHGNARKQAKLAIADLFSKTFDAMAAAPEIKALERRRVGESIQHREHGVTETRLLSASVISVLD